MIIDESNYLAHYGILRRSGRYPWGSGKDQSTRNKSFLGEVERLRKEGLTEKEIATGFGITTTELRAAKSIAKNEQKNADIIMARKLKAKAMSNVAIAERMGKPESTIRSLLASGEKEKEDILQTVASVIKENVDEKRYLDVGAGVNLHLGVSETRFKTAIAILQEQGYKIYYPKLPQLGTKNETTFKILTPPDVTGPEVYNNLDKIAQIKNFSTDGGRSFFGLLPPLSVNPDRVGVVYADQGGSKADGVIYVRPGVPDISLGNSRYAQVRIKVGEGHYLKGMAMYKDDLPEGVDLLFNTNKKDTGNKLDALKATKDDPDNPFGAVVRQIVQREDGTVSITGFGANRPSGKEKVISAMNIVQEEGNWGNWSDTLSTQFLSKQPRTLVKKQLDMSYENRLDEYERILSLTNPTVRKNLLEKFADETDSASVHLKAAALPRQGFHVILPMQSLPPGQVYAPNYKDGETVSLVRFPHGGVFEIPTLTVNNKHKESRKLLGDAPDAIAIHHSVAEILSGADFDGDTVLVIPNNDGRVLSKKPLEGLKNFDPKTAYPGYPGMKPMSSKQKGLQMGDVSNLITDMTLRNASNSEITRAIKHSMVVIDAEKWNLDWKRSAIDNGIPDLKAKYQGGKKAGATTLISRARAPIFVPARRLRKASEGGPIDPVTGEKVYVDASSPYVNKKGVTVYKKMRSQKLAETPDAFTLSSGTPIETTYAQYSNKLKALANKARLDSINVKVVPYSPTAKKAYAKEVESLNSKLIQALKNAPLERQAQVIGNSVLKLKEAQYPDMDSATKKKVKGQALEEARNRTGAKKDKVIIDDREWEAIQAGAISPSKLQDIITNSDLDVLKSLASPKESILMTSTKKSRAESMLASGYTRSEVASALGVSVSTLDRSLG